MEILSDRLMADFACLEPIYVDGIAGVLNLGANFATLFFRWIPVSSANGIINYERTPAMNIVRPVASRVCKSCVYGWALDAQRAPEAKLSLAH